MRFGDWKEKKWFPYTVATCSAVVLFVILMNLGSIGGALGKLCSYFSPVVIGIVVAYVIEPLVMYIQKKVFFGIKNKKLNRTLSVILALIVVLLILVIILSALIPQLFNSLVTFVGNFDTYSGQLETMLENLSSRFGAMHLDLSGILKSNINLLNNLENHLPDYLDKIIAASTAVGGHMMNWVMGIILAVYFLFDKERMLWGARALIILLSKTKKYRKAFTFLKSCNDIMVKYIICELVEGVVVGGVNLIFMMIMGMPYAVLVSVVVGVTNMVPTFGPVIGAAVGGLVLLLVSPWKALGFLIFTIILQLLDGYVLKPKMYGETLGVSSVMILVSIIVGGKMFGMVGILLAIPFAAIVSIIYTKLQDNLVDRMESRLGSEADNEETTGREK